jgi:putative alpha-1,2-mannosidase
VVCAECHGISIRFAPAEPVYSIGRPVFDKVEINLPDGKVFSIVAKNNSAENMYVQSVKLNGEPLAKQSIF